MWREKKFYEALLQSWEKCINLELAKDIEKPLIKLSKKDLAERLEKNSNMIYKFDIFMDNHLKAIRGIEGDYCLVLFDKDGYVLNVRYGVDKSKRKYRGFIMPGTSFNEKSIGTNAITFAEKFNHPIYMLPQFHYCTRLKKWYEYCIPLRFNGIIDGYISIISVQYPVSKALKGFVDLLAVNMRNEPLNLSGLSDTERLGNRLTQRQYIVLKMIAEGMSDENISRELKISLSTVKYHNQCIFKILNATCRVDAVIKGILLNEISISELYNVTG